MKDMDEKDRIITVGGDPRWTEAIVEGDVWCPDCLDTMVLIPFWTTSYAFCLNCKKYFVPYKEPSILQVEQQEEPKLEQSES